jgi:DNA-binding NtrC family response regulator
MKVVTVNVPPLRERPEDIEGLVRAILSEGGEPIPTLGRGILRKLRGLDWPGNVRQLKNALARARLGSPEVITPQALERSLSEPRTSTYFPRNLLGEEKLLELEDGLERDYIVFHLRRLHGDREALMEFLGLGRRQLYPRCAKLGIVLRKLRRGMQ